MTDLTDTGDVREKMLALWRKLDQGKISDTALPKVPLKKFKVINGRKAA
jgi:hypothetical protein